MVKKFHGQVWLKLTIRFYTSVIPMGMSKYGIKNGRKL